VQHLSIATFIRQKKIDWFGLNKRWGKNFNFNFLSTTTRIVFDIPIKDTCFCSSLFQLI
jgi:hypothetical protein